ncbi:hypothetical protein [Parvibaculum sp.]|jgi:hypothetical protein|uniref:hypothetical protein n=1 Tax=Parvibaculum sp. TaxID=2024848 RepID=UPI000C4CE7AB|nr:hypothetical protein [Parvibaculum sp.]MAM95429.1 hypothetical protein [Parvibaculum sp.]HCX66230.1 hypothetical protein [Rhodobiaceae bacterium]|tara:strand:- start:7645 stop:7866 length:222 start_codon:yes stop_codon:yes gene_type:complete
MTSAQHLASNVAAHTRSLGADITSQAERLWTVVKTVPAKAFRGFNGTEAFVAGGYTLLSLYAAGFVAYIAAIY